LSERATNDPNYSQPQRDKAEYHDGSRSVGLDRSANPAYHNGKSSGKEADDATN
jgi:hypothetical protein